MFQADLTILTDASLDTEVKTNKYDNCGIKRKKFVLFPATDLTASELFRTELSECENGRVAGVVRVGENNLKF